MEPTIKNTEFVLVSCVPYLFSKPKVGDIVLIRHSGLSRISLPLEGNERDSGVARLRLAPQNDEKGNKYFIKRIAKIDDERYFVGGDNKKDSLDSKKMGWVGRNEIMGKAIHRISNPHLKSQNLKT